VYAYPYHRHHLVLVEKKPAGKKKKKKNLGLTSGELNEALFTAEEKRAGEKKISDFGAVGFKISDFGSFAVFVWKEDLRKQITADL